MVVALVVVALNLLCVGLVCRWFLFLFLLHLCGFMLRFVWFWYLVDFCFLANLVFEFVYSVGLGSSGLCCAVLGFLGLGCPCGLFADLVFCGFGGL